MRYVEVEGYYIIYARVPLNENRLKNDRGVSITSECFIFFEILWRTSVDIRGFLPVYLCWLGVSVGMYGLSVTSTLSFVYLVHYASCITYNNLSVVSTITLV